MIKVVPSAEHAAVGRVEHLVPAVIIFHYNVLASAVENRAAPAVDELVVRDRNVVAAGKIHRALLVEEEIVIRERVVVDQRVHMRRVPDPLGRGVSVDTQTAIHHEVKITPCEREVQVAVRIVAVDDDRVHTSAASERALIDRDIVTVISVYNVILGIQEREAAERHVVRTVHRDHPVADPDMIVALGIVNVHYRRRGVYVIFAPGVKLLGHVHQSGGEVIGPVKLSGAQRTHPRLFGVGDIALVRLLVESAYGERILEPSGRQISVQLESLESVVFLYPRDK